MKRDENVSFIEKIVFDHVHGDVRYIIIFYVVPLWRVNIILHCGA
jgi:hypothetical protein